MGPAGGGSLPPQVTWVATYKQPEGGLTTINISAGTFEEGDTAIILSGSETPTWTVTGSGATSTARGGSGGSTYQTVPITTGDTAIVAGAAMANCAICIILRNVNQANPLINGALGASGIAPTITIPAGGMMLCSQIRSGSIVAITVSSWAGVDTFSQANELDAFGTDYSMNLAWAEVPAGGSTDGATFSYTVNAPYSFAVNPVAA